ncbi:AtpZ/AtpI family protein [Hyphomicrobium sp. ghe19]|uniref:AtpZ/AtpI family protein n=1 Tax=Hyphomicrobium sp. ghe19 TaxID=2682968 RepID=UPI0013675946|nr:ATP synthase protein I [Hyphomicrobium sp. ghe19]
MSADGKGQRPEGGEISPEDREAIRKRSAEIGQKLDALQSKKAQRSQADRSATGGSQQSAYGAAFKFAAELLVGVVVGGGLGWALDRQFGTAPWLMVLLVIMGFAAGLLNVVRAAQQAQTKNEPLQRAAPSVKDDDGE